MMRIEIETSDIQGVYDRRGLRTMYRREIETQIAYRKILNCILTSKTIEHIESCHNMIDNYLRIYGPFSPTIYIDRARTLRGLANRKRKAIMNDD